MANELDPCPFCGCGMMTHRAHVSSEGEWWAIIPNYALSPHMNDCPLSALPAPKFTKVEECVIAWNNRRTLSLPSEVSSDLNVTVETLRMARDGSAERMRGAIKAAIRTLITIQAIEVPTHPTRTTAPSTQEHQESGK